MTSIHQKLARLSEDFAKTERRYKTEREILTVLPGELPAPTISNADGTFFGTPGAWLSFSRDYVPHGEAETPGSAILAALETAGFQPLPVTVCKWDDWRPGAEPGEADAIPDTKGRYTLTDTTPVAPLWIEPNQHTGTEARAYYAFGGRVFKVTVPGPRTAYVHARKIEYHGGWRFESETATVRFPDAWHSIEANNEPVAGISHLTRAYTDTEQGISGVIYFELLRHGQTEFPLTPAALLRVLETEAKP